MKPARLHAFSHVLHLLSHMLTCTCTRTHKELIHTPLCASGRACTLQKCYAARQTPARARMCSPSLALLVVTFALCNFTHCFRLPFAGHYATSAQAARMILAAFDIYVAPHICSSINISAKMPPCRAMNRNESRIASFL